MFLVYSFIFAVFLYILIFFLSYCVWGLLFPGFKESWILCLKNVEFFFAFGFCPPKIGPVVCVSFVYSEISAEFLIVCFSSDGEGWVRWYSCLLITGFVFLFCLLFQWGVPHRVLLVVGWCQVLYSSGFLCVGSHHLILPRVSSLVVWSQCSHSKGSGFDLWSGTKIPQVVYYGIMLFFH